MSEFKFKGDTVYVYSDILGGRQFSITTQELLKSNKELLDLLIEQQVRHLTINELTNALGYDLEFSRMIFDIARTETLKLDINGCMDMLGVETPQELDNYLSNKPLGLIGLVTMKYHEYILNQDWQKYISLDTVVEYILQGGYWGTITH